MSYSVVVLRIQCLTFMQVQSFGSGQGSDWAQRKLWALIQSHLPG